MIGLINIELFYKQIASYFIFNYFNFEVDENEIVILKDEIVILGKICDFYAEIKIENNKAIDIHCELKTWEFSTKYIGDNEEAKKIALKMINDFLSEKDNYNIYSNGYYYDN